MEKSMSGDEGIQYFKDVFAQLALAAPAGQRLLDVGSGDARLSRWVARTLSASQLYLLDPYEAPGASEPSCPEQYLPMSAGDLRLRSTLRGQFDSIISCKSVHEMDNPGMIALLLSLFPKDGKGLIAVCDYSRGYWEPANLERLSAGCRAHADDDLARIKRTGLFEREGIVTFWNDAFDKVGLGSPRIMFNDNDQFYWLVHTGNDPLWDETITVSVEEPQT